MKKYLQDLLERQQQSDELLFLKGKIIGNYLQDLLGQVKVGDILICVNSYEYEGFEEYKEYEVVKRKSIKFIEDDEGNLILNSVALFKIKEEKDKGDFPWSFDSGDTLICVEEDNIFHLGFKVGVKYHLYKYHGNEGYDYFLIDDNNFFTIKTYAKFKRAD
jgi:hypothetical protein